MQHISDTSDARFLVNTEQSLLKIAQNHPTGINNYPDVFEPGYHHAFYLVPLTKSEIETRLNPYPYSKLPDHNTLFLSWNLALDSFWLMGMTPAIYSPAFNSYLSPLLIPANRYCTPHLTISDSMRYKKCMAEQLEKAFDGSIDSNNQLHITRKLDTSYFDMLPHARLDELMKKIKTAITSSADLHIYSDRLLTAEIQDKYGIFMNMEYQPRKNEMTWMVTEFNPVKFLIYEQWVPFSAHGKYLFTNNSGYRREVIAMGMELSNGQQVWFNPQAMYTKLKPQVLSFATYEEVFRAERFRTHRILPD